MLRPLVLAVLVTLAAREGWAAPSPSYELFNYDPVANPQAVVVSGNARFTVLTDRLLRLEYSTTGSFEDRPTVAILNRNLPVPAYTANTAGNQLTITTGSLRLQYTVNTTFSDATLQITSLPTVSPSFRWTPSSNNAGNLLGTIKSLDELGVITLNCTQNAGTKVHDEDLHCEWGVVSRAGWAVVNDVTNYGLTPGAEWWDGPNTNQADMYFFGHGHQYKAALQDFTAIAGRIPMIPRHANGIWWTRWYDLNNVDVREIVFDYQSHSIPLDVFVLDMDWHQKNNWGGYTFDAKLFPYPSDTLGLLKDQRIALAANLHDDNGVGNYDAMYPEMCAALGLDPSKQTSIPFSVVNKSYIYALEDIVLEAVIQQGMDFWWIDYQQGGTQGGATGLKQNPTVWTDKIRVTDPKRQGKNLRGLVLARWGGLGTHRYQVGFSGDVAALSWENLAFQPYFSSTSTNVGYGFWSHDLEGPSDDNEMYTRWIQWGSFSGVFRSHDRGMSAGNCYDTVPESCSMVKVWELPDKYYEPARAAMVEREELIPYIYTATRQAFDTGLSLLRPMYYEFPESDEAYWTSPTGNISQYFFGSDMIVAPIVAPASYDNMTNASVWIPPGTWVEQRSGQLRTGPVLLQKPYDITEVPIFVRAGAIIPKIPVNFGDTIGVAARSFSALRFDIYPGSSSGTTQVYEDDGQTLDYLQGDYSWTTVQYTRSSTTTCDISISVNGSFSSMSATRAYTVRLLNALPPTSVAAGSTTITYSRSGGDNTWSFDGNDMSLTIQLAAVPSSSSVDISVTFMQAIDDHLISGIKGMIFKANLAKRNLDETRSTPGAHTPTGGQLMLASSMGDGMSFLAGTNPQAFIYTLNTYRSLFANAQLEIQSLKGVNAARLQYSIALLNSANM